MTNEILQPWTSEKKGGEAIVKASYYTIKVKYLQLHYIVCRCLHCELLKRPTYICEPLVELWFLDDSNFHISYVSDNHWLMCVLIVCFSPLSLSNTNLHYALLDCFSPLSLSNINLHYLLSHLDFYLEGGGAFLQVFGFFSATAFVCSYCSYQLWHVLSTHVLYIYIFPYSAKISSY